MKIYRTNQESINKGIHKSLINDNNWTILIKQVNHYSEYGWDIMINIDNRIKGFCLKEIKLQDKTLQIKDEKTGLLVELQSHQIYIKDKNSFLLLEPKLLQEIVEKYNNVDWDEL